MLAVLLVAIILGTGYALCLAAAAKWGDDHRWPPR